MVLARITTFMMRVAVTALMSSGLTVTFAAAHEVQPTVADITIGADTVTIDLQWVIEAPTAGLDLEGVADTNDAENAEDYDALRALSSEELEQRFRAAWAGISSGIVVAAGDEALPFQITGIEVPAIGDIELPRTSTVALTAPLPVGDGAVTLTWPGAFGPLVVRQMGVENGYTAFLTAGGSTDPIPRTGGDDQTAGEAFVDYIGVGFDHIIPLGLDHILFVLGLFFLALKLRPLLWQVTAFTLAHTVTLALGAMDIIRISPDIVEPLIAASIVYVGVENVLSRGLTPWRPVIVFMFGLLHGLGFASVLSDFGLGASNFVPKLIGFNVGVELGQLAVIAAAFVCFGVLFGNHDWYRRRISGPVSIAISAIAVFWVLERTGMIDAGGAWAPFALLTEGGLPAFWTAIACGAVGGLLTVIVIALPGQDRLRDLTGIVTSFVLFMGVVATFTSGAFLMAAALTAVWILAIRFQSLGGPDA